MDDDMLNQRQVAQALGVSVNTLAKWRRQKRGPTPWFKVSQTLILYPRRAIRAWLSEHRQIALTG